MPRNASSIDTFVGVRWIRRPEVLNQVADDPCIAVVQVNAVILASE